MYIHTHIHFVRVPEQMKISKLDPCLRFPCTQPAVSQPCPGIGNIWTKASPDDTPCPVEAHV